MTIDGTNTVRVAELVAETQDVLSIVLEPVAGARLPHWEPGAHIDVLTGTGLERQYSLCSDPSDEARWRIAVLREPESRGGSEWLHTSLSVGDNLRVRGPRNNFALGEAAGYVFIAGGIGITPLLPMIAEVDRRGADWTLVYGGRRDASMAFTHELERYGDRVVLWPQDRHGLIDLEHWIGTPRSDVLVYSCGPGALLDAVEPTCAPWPSGSLRIERFRPRDGALAGENTPFEVVFKRSGVSAVVGSTESIVDLAEAAGVRVQTSCGEGTCGSCEADVLEGTPDHRDSYLTAEEQEEGDTMMICCSRSSTPRLVLDL